MATPRDSKARTSWRRAFNISLPSTTTMSTNVDQPKLVLPTPDLMGLPAIDVKAKDEDNAAAIAELRTQIADIDHFVHVYPQECKEHVATYLDALKKKHNDDLHAMKTRLNDTLTRLSAVEARIRQLEYVFVSSEVTASNSSRRGDKERGSTTETDNDATVAATEGEDAPDVEDRDTTENASNATADLFPSSDNEHANRKEYEPRNLHLHVEHATCELGELLGYIKKGSSNGKTSKKTKLRGGPKYGCFKALEESAYIVNHFAAVDRSRRERLLEMETQINKELYEVDAKLGTM